MVSCGPSEAGEADFRGVYTVFTPDDGTRRVTGMELLHIEDDGVAFLESADCFGEGGINSRRVGVWERDGKRLRIGPAEDGERVLGWLTEEVEVSLGECESLEVSYERVGASEGPTTTDWYKYVPCWVLEPPDQNANPGPRTCSRRPCPDETLPNCEWAE